MPTTDFHVGQEVLRGMAHSPHKGIVRKVEKDYILVDIPGISDHCRFEPGFNLAWVRPINR